MNITNVDCKAKIIKKANDFFIISDGLDLNSGLDHISEFLENWKVSCKNVISSDSKFYIKDNDILIPLS